MKAMRLAGIVVAVALTASCALPAAETNVSKRSRLKNPKLRFEREKKGHVAFLGGSITEMNGYRPMVCEMLKKRFPETEFTFTNAGISSTCSTTGAFRLKTDVLDKGPVDMLFIDFAVNDDQDAGHTREACIRGMEGITRHVRKHNPRAELVFVYFVNGNMMDLYRKGKTPVPIAAHEEVAEHYNVSTINLAREVTTRIDKGEFDWKKFGGVHPAAFGNRIAADMVGQLFSASWDMVPAAIEAPEDHPVPEKPLDMMNYQHGRFLDPKEVKLPTDWALHVPDWKALPGGKRGRFTQLPILECTKPGAPLTVAFTGSAIGAYLLAGPDAGTVDVRIDGGDPRGVDLYHHYSRGLHYPRTVLFADGLAPGKHTLTLTLSTEKNKGSKGTAFRAMQFTVNGY